MVYGYCRVSTKGQAVDGNSLDAQEKLLREHGATIIFKESFTGTKTDRPEFDKLKKTLKAGDTIIVTKLDRIARTSTKGYEQVKEWFDMGVTVNILNMGIANNSTTGKLMLQIMFAFAEFERNMIVERTQEGKAIAKQNNPNFKEGRPRTDDKLIKLVVELSKNNHTIKEIVEITKLSRSTVMRIRKDYLADELNQ